LSIWGFSGGRVGKERSELGISGGTRVRAGWTGLASSWDCSSVLVPLRSSLVTDTELHLLMLYEMCYLIFRWLLDRLCQILFTAWVNLARLYATNLV
jgi:hypothetical protein